MTNKTLQLTVAILAGVLLGERLALADGREAVVWALRIEHARAGQTFTTYNFEVEDFHTYFVGKEGVWVHNAGQACEKLFSAYKFVLEKGNRGDPVEAFQHVLQRLGNKLESSLKPGFVDDVVKHVDDLKKAGQLDQHLLDLGKDVATGGGFRAREAFAGRRFELLKGKTLTRSTDKAWDFVDELGHKWDTWAPPSSVPNQTAEQYLSRLLDSVEKKLTNNPSSGIKTLFELEGLTPPQKASIAAKIKSKFPQGTFEILGE